MPEISRFYGIRITMNFGDHLPPHFHAEYGSDEGMVSIRAGEVFRGYLPSRARRLVTERAELLRLELEDNWERAHSDRPLLRVAPL